MKRYMKAKLNFPNISFLSLPLCILKIVIRDDMP